jgi:leucyl-tRNA synthetase
MELVNSIFAFDPKNHPANAPVLKEAVESVILLLEPFVPHICEELWESLGHSGGIEASGWPSFDAEAAVEDELLIVVQVNGKLRGKITVEASAAEGDVKAAALNNDKVKSFMDGKSVKKVIYVPGKLVNIVVG